MLNVPLKANLMNRRLESVHDRYSGPIVADIRKVIKARYHTDANDQLCERMSQVATTTQGHADILRRRSFKSCRTDIPLQMGSENV